MSVKFVGDPTPDNKFDESKRVQLYIGPYVIYVQLLTIALNICVSEFENASAVLRMKMRLLYSV